MQRRLHWHELLTINIYTWGLSSATGIITPVLLPFLLAQFVPADRKNTYLAIVRVVSLAIAMAVQPMAGLLSDRSRLHWGRRRPFIAAGTLLSLVFLLLLGFSPKLAGTLLDGAVRSSLNVSAPFVALMAGVVLWQGAANIAQGAHQGLIPDLVPENQRGRASGVKAVLDLLAVVPIILVGPMIDAGRIWLTTLTIACALTFPMGVTLIGVHEQPSRHKPEGRLAPQLLRPILLSGLFVGITWAGGWAVRSVHSVMNAGGFGLGGHVAAVAATGLGALAFAIVAGVRLGVMTGLGSSARGQSSFVWWVTSRLFFGAAIGTIQGYTQYFLTDVHGVHDVGKMTTLLGAVLGVFLIASALMAGHIADRIGSKRPLVVAGLIAAAGTLLLILAPGLPLVFVSACILGVASGAFMATNWALGTRLVPADEAGRYLGIANLAGAGAGIVGAGIGGPMVDLVNTLKPGLGYTIAFGLYGVLFLLSALALTPVRQPVSQLPDN